MCVFVNRVLGRIFGPVMDEVTREWRELHNEELSDLYCSPNILRKKKIEMNEMGVSCNTFLRERSSVYRVLVRKPEEMRPLGKPRHRWENNIKMDIQEVECAGMDWIDIARDRDRWRVFVIAVMNLRVP